MEDRNGQEINSGQYLKIETGQVCLVEWSDTFHQLVGKHPNKKIKGAWLPCNQDEIVDKPTVQKARMYCAMIPFPGIEIEETS